MRYEEKGGGRGGGEKAGALLVGRKATCVTVENLCHGSSIHPHTGC